MGEEKVTSDGKVLVVNGKSYNLYAPPSPKQDGSDLALYDEIEAKALQRKEKNWATCSAISIIAGYILFIKTLRAGEEMRALTSLPERNRAIMALKFCAVRIWNDGRNIDTEGASK